MNLKTHIRTQKSAVALVITLLMLSVIAFLAIAFLSMTNRNRTAVNASLDFTTAKTMSDAALSRAQTQIIAQMMAVNDILSYDYTASRNYINPNGYDGSVIGYNPANVNYDSLGGSTSPNWAQNIANLWFDPRPPVFVLTNGNPPNNDFRYWVDINRNGRFESNGLVNMLDINGNLTTISNFYNGEPEWIGVLKYPQTNHSPNNPFVGRYAFMVLPIGKTLDWNFIHNYSKAPGAVINPLAALDGFARDEGVGSWELNLAALLNDTSSTIYQVNPSNGPYNYAPAAGPAVAAASPNTGACFDDAVQFIGYRYSWNSNSASYPESLFNLFGNAVLRANDIYGGGNDVIDEYGGFPNPNSPFDYNNYSGTFPNPTMASWPGSYNTNMFYDVQDLFDSSKTGPYFASRLLATMTTNLNSYDRYTMQRLLATIGTSSTPEYGVYVYSNLFTNSVFPTNNGIVPPPTLLHTKININYDNTAQIQAGPYSPYGNYTPMPTNLVPWTNAGNNGLNFFTNAADSLLRSQIFTYTNYVLNAGGVYVQSNYLLATFGITNIPIYAANNPGIVYTEQVHRMLQVAANIYAAANPAYIKGVPQPPVFRPLFNLVNGGTANAILYISGFTNVTAAGASAQLFPNPNFKDLTNALTGAAGIQTNDNVWGIPWIIGAVTNVPEFDQYSYQSRVLYQRQIQFNRAPNLSNPPNYITNAQPKYTNVFYIMSVSNICGMDAWNPYASSFSGSSGTVYVVASNYVTVTITNNYLFGTNIYFGNYTNGLVATSANPWPGYVPNSGISPFQTFLQTNSISLPYSYFSESTAAPIGAFIVQTNNSTPYLTADTTQTSYPTHNWTVSITNHIYYVLFDGPPGTGNVLDFVNLGPFGGSFPITQYLQTNNINPDPFSFYGRQQESFSNSWWIAGTANDAGSGGIPLGVLNQISLCQGGTNIYLRDSLTATGSSIYPASQASYGPGVLSLGGPQYIGAYANYAISNSWMACDPLVHYTLGDLTYPGFTQPAPANVSVSSADVPIYPPLNLSTGTVTIRYAVGTSGTNGMVFEDPGMSSANKWQFPANLFPGVGWLGRVHRGTPWETIYLKSDDPDPTTSYQNWTTTWVNSPFTYPTNDWSLVDLFTAVPNDNAARGLLSVNQTNDAAWAAVFAGVIAMTNTAGGIAINPTNDVYNIMDGPNGINAARTNQPGAPGQTLFHKIGDILQASALTTNSPFVTNFIAQGGVPTDEMVERIPQQTLSLLKLGMPQFVIYSWGQSLKPSGIPYSGAGLFGLSTNYEITGESLTRTVCHVISPDGTAGAPKIIIDNFNIEPGN